MNANELADDWIEIADDNQIYAMSVDELVNYLNGWYSTAAPRKAATMLRQQQAEIEALKATISELEYVMSFGENGYEDLDKHGKDGLIPHYTHPVELTEETKEALIVTRSIAMRMAAEARIPECGDFAKIAQCLDFACDELAILRKAQE